MQALLRLEWGKLVNPSPPSHYPRPILARPPSTAVSREFMANLSRLPAILEPDFHIRWMLTQAHPRMSRGICHSDFEPSQNRVLEFCTRGERNGRTPCYPKS